MDGEGWVHGNAANRAGGGSVQIEQRVFTPVALILNTSVTIIPNRFLIEIGGW